jgi:hypothetical protein
MADLDLLEDEVDSLQDELASLTLRVGELERGIQEIHVQIATIAHKLQLWVTRHAIENKDRKKGRGNG